MVATDNYMTYCWIAWIAALTAFARNDDLRATTFLENDYREKFNRNLNT